MRITVADTGYVGLSLAVLQAQGAPTFFGSRVADNLNAFKAEADVIVANRVTAELEDVRDKVYTRDVYGGDA